MTDNAELTFPPNLSCCACDSKLVAIRVLSRITSRLSLPRHLVAPQSAMVDKFGHRCVYLERKLGWVGLNSTLFTRPVSYACCAVNRLVAVKVGLF